jgi:hypothetical protein
LYVLALVTACAVSEPAATTQLANRVATGPAEVVWRASSAGSGDDGEQLIDITLALRGRVIAHDVMCCEPVTADECHAHADGSDAVYIVCAEELTRWEAKLVAGAIVVTRIDTLIEQRERRQELARIPTAAMSLVLER